MTTVVHWTDILGDLRLLDLYLANARNKITGIRVNGGDEGTFIDFDSGVYVKDVPAGMTTVLGPPPSAILLTSVEHRTFATAIGAIAYVWQGPAETKLAKYDNRDSMPAMIVATGLKVHHAPLNSNSREYTHPQSINERNRLWNLPFGESDTALRANHVFAHWFENGKRFRLNGPAMIRLNDYREDWLTGRICYREFKSAEELISLGPEHNKPFTFAKGSFQSKHDPTRIPYFTEPLDEFIFKTDNAP